MGLSVFFSNFVPFMILSCLMYLPSLSIAYFGPQYIDVEYIGMLGIFIIIVEVIFYSILIAALVYGAVQHINGTPASFMSCLTRGLSTMLPVLGIAIVVGIVVVLGLIALIIPGLILVTMFWVVVPAAVIERKGVGASMDRSRKLTYGHRWAIFGIIILLGLGQGLTQWLASLVLVPSRPLQMQDLLPWFIGDWLITAFFAGLAASMVGVGYYLLRSEKEGADIKTLAAVFD